MSNELQTITNDAEVSPFPASDPSDQALERLVKQAKAMQAAHQLGTALAGTKMVPQAYQGQPDDATAAIMYGSELGMSAVQSLQNIFIVRGKPAVYSRTMVAQTIAAGHHVFEVEASPESVTWAGKRGDNGTEFTATWTIDRAKQAGFLSNDKYKSQPIEMLRAKAQAEVCRNLAPDVLLGMAHSREELELDQPAAGAPRRVASTRPDVDALRARLAGAKEQPAAVSKPTAADPVESETAAPSKDALTTLTGLFTAAGLDGRAKARRKQVTETLLGRVIEDDTPMTGDECAQVIEVLAAWQADGVIGEKVVALLDGDAQAADHLADAAEMDDAMSMAEAMADEEAGQ